MDTHNKEKDKQANNDENIKLKAVFDCLDKMRYSKKKGKVILHFDGQMIKQAEVSYFL